MLKTKIAVVTVVVTATFDQVPHVDIGCGDTSDTRLTLVTKCNNMKILHYDYCDQIVTMIIIITILSKYAQSFSKVVKNKLKSFKKVFSLKKP